MSREIHAVCYGVAMGDRKRYFRDQAESIDDILWSVRDKIE